MEEPFKIRLKRGKMTQKVYREERTEYLMNKFIDHTDNVDDLLKSGCSALELHDEQLHAANVYYDLEQEGLFDTVEEMYPWEMDRLKDYKEIWIKFGAKEEQK